MDRAASTQSPSAIASSTPFLGFSLKQATCPTRSNKPLRHALRSGAFK